MALDILSADLLCGLVVTNSLLFYLLPNSYPGQGGRLHLTTKIISGGQTGVDRAALDAAMDLGLPCGGWCPKGRRAEDGVIPSRYPLQETSSAQYPQRTQWNVRDSDGTLILIQGQPKRNGTALTIETAKRLRKPCLVLDLAAQPDLSIVQTWVERQTIQTLNVAGPRESTCPGIYAEARRFLTAFLTR
jgi:putative molybdenum carrier protein